MDKELNIRLAKTAGFCFGVQRAVDRVYEIIEREQKKPPGLRKRIYTYGPIVHNDTVVKKLSDIGVQVLLNEEELKALKDGIVIIRAHGVSEEIYNVLSEGGLEVIDASCPFVKKIQALVREHTEKGIKTAVAGNPEHPEIIGIMGHAHGECIAIPDEKHAEQMPVSNGEKLVLLAQTTFNIDKFKVIVEILQKKGYYVSVINTICNATFERQTEAGDLAKESDAMIVIGGSSSSNTKKLFEICRASCPNTQLVQTAADLKFYSDGAVRNVGITAGASTPKEIIEEVLTYVRNEF